jgi:hypothetical protein
MTGIKELAGWILRGDCSGKNSIYFVELSNRIRYEEDKFAVISENPLKAKLFQSFDQLLETARKLRKKSSEFSGYEIRPAKLIVCQEDENFLEGEMLNIIQQKAVKKLEDDEVEALEVKRIAMMNKLDMHLKDNIKEFYPEEKFILGK